MLKNANHLKGLVIRATDGEIGTVDQLYFDDETWAIRYLMIETGGWLGGRRVLISPISVVHTDWQAKRLDVALTKKQVENSPDIDTHKPVSRQHEAANISGITDIPITGAEPFCGDRAITRRDWLLKSLLRKRPKRWKESRKSRRIRIYAVLQPSPAITSRLWMAKSAMWQDFSWTMKPGLSATLRWQRAIGGRARRYWFHPRGFKR
jgi:hypothetical protein